MPSNTIEKEMDESALSSQESGALEEFFLRPFFLSLTIGIPFCIFKLLFGLTAVRVASLSFHTLLYLFGWVVIFWALADLAMNSGRAALDLLHRQAGFEYCTIAQVGTCFRMPLVFLAFDTMLSFVIICAMLWSGWITILTRTESYLWYAATTMNLISLSLVLLHNEIKKVQEKKDG